MPSRHSLLVAALLLATGCAISPYSGQSFYGSNVIPVDGFAHASDATVQIEAYNWSSATYDYVVTAYAASTPTLNAGTMCSNSPALYRYKRDVTLNSNYWKVINGKSTAKMRAAQFKNGNRQVIYFTNNSNGGYCMTQYANTQTCDFYNVAYNQCGFNLTEAVFTR